MKNSRRIRLLLKAVTVLLVLSVLTACKSIQINQDDSAYNTAVLNMLPPMPQFPQWPMVTWIYQNGMYSLKERDADLILNYKENELFRFRWELEQYQKQLEVIISSLSGTYRQVSESD